MSTPIRADRSQLMLLPRSIDEFVAPDDPVRLVAEIVGAICSSLKLSDSDPSMPGAPAYASEMLLSVWLYGYVRRIRSTRQLEIACRERIAVMWLTGMKYPDHNTLWRFYKNNREAIRDAFAKVLLVAKMNNMVGMVTHALDGTKLQAASSTETAVHRDKLRDELSNLKAAIEEIEKLIEQTNSQETGETKLPAALSNQVARKKTVEAQLQQLEAAQTPHLHPLEPEAKPMPVRATGVKLGFNAQAVVDENQLIVAQGVTNEVNDYSSLVTMLESAEANLGERPEQTLTDGGYISARSLKAATEKNFSLVVAAGALANAEARPENPYDKTHFRYDRERDVFICPQGELLPLSRLKRDKAASAEKAEYRCLNKQCPVKSQCTKNRAGRTVTRSPDDESIEKQRAKQADPEFAKLYARRKTIVEPVFGQIKANDGFRRFTARGFENVRTQWALVCTAHNLRKMIPAWVANGCSLALA